MPTDIQSRNDRIGIAGCFLFAVVSLDIGVSETRALLHLLSHGERADAQVVAIDVGVKGGKKAVFEFTTTSGEEVTARDLFQMYLIRHKPGDAVTALYAPAEPTRATIDIGRWMWQEPGLAYFGFVFFCGLGILIGTHDRRRVHRVRSSPERAGSSVPASS